MEEKEYLEKLEEAEAMEEPKKKKVGVPGIVVSSIFLAISLITVIIGILIKISWLQAKDPETGGEVIGYAFAAIFVIALAMLLALVSLAFTIVVFIISLKRVISKTKPLPLGIVYLVVSSSILIINILIMFCKWA